MPPLASLPRNANILAIANQPIEIFPVPTSTCPLCQDPGQPVCPGYHACPQCAGIFLGTEHLPTPQAEERHYRTHNNDIHDPRYQAFVAPIVEAVLSNYGPSHAGLDFGAGTGPVITHLLQAQGYAIEPYDPFFHPRPQCLAQTYDYIACCEVIEHFHHPAREFALLKKLLNPGGSLFCMTQLYLPEIKFETWYYKNDPTHIFFLPARNPRMDQNSFWLQPPANPKPTHLPDPRLALPNKGEAMPTIKSLIESNRSE